MGDRRFCLMCNEQVPFNTLKRCDRTELTCIYCGLTLEISSTDEAPGGPEVSGAAGVMEKPPVVDLGFRELEESGAAHVEVRAEGIQETKVPFCDRGLQELRRREAAALEEKEEEPLPEVPAEAAAGAEEQMEHVLPPPAVGVRGIPEAEAWPERMVEGAPVETAVPEAEAVEAAEREEEMEAEPVSMAATQEPEFKDAAAVEDVSVAAAPDEPECVRGTGDLAAEETLGKEETSMADEAGEVIEAEAKTLPVADGPAGTADQAVKGEGRDVSEIGAPVQPPEPAAPEMKKPALKEEKRRLRRPGRIFRVPEKRTTPEPEAGLEQVQEEEIEVSQEVAEPVFDREADLREKERLRSHFERQIKLALIADDKRLAFKNAVRAMEKLPFDPLILSYFGFLSAEVERDLKYGAKLCRDAVTILDTYPSGAGEIAPTLYLHLGKVYLLSNRKNEAVAAFRKGLESDHKNWGIKRELKRLGIRRKPPIPFLDRGNPINKYIGLFITRMKKKGRAALV